MTKPRPTEAEFEELKRKREESFSAWLTKMCAEQGWDPKDVHVHRSNSSGCYCNCPDGPCQHEWDGPGHDIDMENGGGWTATCSKCGEWAINHDMRCGP